MKLRWFKRLRFLLAAHERVAGISFTDKAVHAALLSSTDKINEMRFATRDLPEHTIEEGIVLDHEELARVIKDILDELGGRITFVNLSLPSTLIFSTIKHLPRTNDPLEHYEKALPLLLDVELPWKRATAYTDHVITKGKEDLIVNIFSIQRSSADPYMLAAEHAGAEVLSVEFDALSTARLMETKDENILIVSTTEAHVNLSVVKNNTVRFMFTLPLAHLTGEDALKKEVTHVRDFFVNETGEQITPGVFGPSIGEASRSLFEKHKEDLGLYPAGGAALRKPEIHPRSRELSLLPLSADELYNLHRITSGLRLLTYGTIATCLILISAHLLLLQLLSKISAQTSARIASAPHLYTDSAAIDKETGAANSAIAMGDAIGAHIERYGTMLGLIDHIATDGITIDAIHASGSTTPITISGIAATRNQYNFFRTSIVTTEQVEVLSFPLGSLDTGVDIPFTLTIRMKSP